MPLSQGQRALWFLHHLAPVGGAYNIAAAARVRTPIDAAALERAFQALVDRHEALRTTFPAAGGEPGQQVAGELDFALACEDVTGWSPERLRERLAEEAWRPFDLERGPLLRVSLFTGDPGGPVILLVIHHIVADFWSLAILMRELPALYREADLPAPGAAYAEHVRLEQEALAGERGEELLAWWRERLAGLPTLELATDRPRPAVQTYRGDTTRLRLPGELAAALRSRSRAQRGTLFMTLVAAFEALLGRHTGQEDLAVGSPRAGRGSSQFAGTVGYFVNPVVLRGDLSGDPAFAELLERTRETVLAAFDHGDYPLPLLAEHLQPERDASRTPLFQVSFVLQKETRGVEGLTAFALGEEGVAVGPEDFRLESLALPQSPSLFDLVLQAVERQGGLSLVLQFNTDLFDGTTAARLLDRYVRLLKGVAADPRQRLSELPLLSEPERAQLLSEWSDTATAPAGELPVHEQVLEQARRRPEALAVATPRESVTYAELASRARSLALHLGRLGVGPEVRVALSAGSSIERVVGSLGVLLAGGAYVLLDPESPSERLAFQVRDAEARVVLTEETIAAASAGREEPPGPAAPVGPDHLAYIVYTSGSTGLPKGVAIPHAGLLNLVRWHRAAYGIGPGDRATLLANPAFDASVWELWPYLAAGASLHLPGRAARLAPAALVRFWRDAGITWSFLPTPLAEEVLAERDLEGLALRGLLCGGDRLHQAPRPGLPFPLINHYGPSEVSVVSTCAAIAPKTPGMPPIGRPVANLRVRVVDPRGGLAPLGAAGELWIGGAGIARGYLARPALTAERFVPDPWSTEPGERLYRTGDLVRHRADGLLEFLGRIDQQVKLRGFRIEPGEIEAALREHLGVEEAVVAVRDGRLVAWVAGAAGSVPPSREQREHLLARLPGYMVPAAWVRLPELPRTPNGKLDRRALPDPEPEESAAEPLAPRTPAEELMAGIFAEVLGAGRIGIEDSFFELGGHSLAALRLVARIREAFGIDLPVHRVFEAPTVAELAAEAAEAGRSSAPALPPLVPVPRDPAAPGLLLSFSQQRLWFFDQLEPASPVYNIPAAIELRGRLDRAALAAALGEVVRRHEALRTRFVAGPAGPLQVIDAPAPIPLPVAVLSNLPAERCRDEARRLAREEALHPFDLAAGPLLRAGLAELGEERQILLLTLHHIVSDGWSMRVLAGELGEIYGSFAQGRPSPLPDLEIQYGDYAVWQRGWLHGDVLEAELAHWRDRLAGAPPVLELPLDRPRPAVMSPRGASRALALPPALLQALQALARQQGVTLFMATLAAFQALLSRVSNTEDVSVGTPVAGRGQIRTEGLIGFFVNTLVLRTDLSGDPSFAALLRRARETALAAYAHQDLPFEKLVEELHPERHLGISPLFQVSFSLESDPAPSLRLGSAEAVLWPLEAETEKFDLSLTLLTEGEGITGELTCRADLFDASTAARLAGCFELLLTDAVATPAKRLSDLVLLGEGERHQLAVEWGMAPQDPFEPVSLSGLFAARAASTPEAPAVIFGGERLSYRELDRRAGRWARGLRRQGAGPETVVGVCLPPSVELVVALLAVWRTGAAFLPLDPAYPAERLEYMLEDSGAPLLVTRRGLPDLEAPGARVLAEELEESGGPEAPEASGHEESLAYVIYTSGSTGRPKGVAVPQGAAVRHMRTVMAAWGLSPADRVLQFASPSFDVWLEETVPALLTGATLVLRGTELWEPARFLDRVRDLGLTVVDLPTAFWQQWVREMAPEDAVPVRLRLVSTGGEAMTAEAARLWLASPLRGVRLLNGYGPTEAVISASFHPVTAPPAGASAPLGYPLPGRSARVLDLLGQLLPAGVPGELCLGGPALARGYLGRPDLTAERFVPDPFSGPEAPGARLYRTGDLARVLPDGCLEFLGRIDQQVKVRGFRIELGEIEAALLAHSGVREAVVLARPSGGSSAGMELAAYVVAEGGEAPNLSGLRGFLRERLPEFMLPAAWAFLPALTLTVNGKVDRKALAAVRPEREPGAEGGSVAPRTPVEELLAGIFAEVLGVERVGVADDFFALGGHSLLATRVTSRIRAVLGLDVPVRTLFEAPTVESLAGRIRHASAADAPPLVRGSREQPLSFAQQRLWFLDQLEPGSPLYNIPAAVELAGRLDVAALEAALGEVVRRHAALRTAFRSLDGEPVQVIAEHTGFALPLIDLQGVSGAEAHRLAAAEARRPFDLSGSRGGLLLRVALLRLAPERHALLLTMHHIVSDGWSMGVLVRELGVLYAACLEGRPSPLPELEIQYADFAAWQRAHLSGERLEAELAWWRTQLAGMPPVLDLPTDHPRPAVRSLRGAIHTFAIPEEDLASLTRLSRQQGATLFMTLLAGFAALLERYTGEDDLSVGSPIAGRTRAETEPLIGLFVNTLVLRTDLSGDPELAEALGRVREATLSAYAHQEVPFERLVEELAPERDLSRTPLVQVLFVLQNAPLGPLELPGLTLRARDVATETAKLDLACSLAEAEGGLEGAIEYSRDLFEASTIERLAGHFVRLLAGAAADPRRRLSELPLLSEAERAQLLAEWGGWATAYPREATLHGLFAAQAALRPDAVVIAGVVGGGESLTYGELKRRAGRWARRLRSLGVGPEVRVALCLDRSPARVVVMLAVLEAGGVYVPLDPGYPRERLAFLLRDSAASVLVTEERSLGALPETGIPVLLLERDEPGEEEAGLPEAPEVSPLSLAYVMYTSGSTGEPKGVAVTHRGVVRLVCGVDYFRFGPDEVFLQAGSYAFDASNLEIWGALLHGSRLVVPPPGVLSPAELGDLFRSHGVTAQWLSPGMFHQMVEENLQGLAGLRQLQAGGDVMSVPHVRTALAELPGLRLTNGYGPTENSTLTTCHAVSLQGLEPSVPLGRPIANTWVYVLDRHLAPVPAGVPGELYTGGDGLARGYLGRPAQTAERFVPDPFGRETGGRLYRTGDLVRWRPSGVLEFLGRLDAQVKVRGFRIEPGEIEAVLALHPWVRNVVVLAEREPAGGQRLAAYLAGEGEPPGVAELRSFLQERLPGFMVPAAYAFLPALPLTPHGKVDRKELAALRLERAEAAVGVAPRTPAEELVAGIFAEVLGLERVGAGDDFFTLGGHSLLATRVASLIRSRFGVDLPVRAVFEAPTVEGLARRLGGSALGGERPLVPVPRRPGEPAVLSFAQQRLWFLDQLEPGSPLYNIPVAVELLGRLDREALEAALGEIVRRHEALRTTFREGPVQVIAESVDFSLPLIEAGTLEEEHRLAAEEAGRPFDLSGLRGGPLLRALLLKSGAERHVLLLNMHHIVSDGWSMGVLVREIGILYAAFRAGRPSPLPELALQYADFAAWQRSHLAGEHLASELAWWRAQLAGMPPALELPADHPRPAARSLRGASLAFTLPELRQPGATLFMVLLAGFAGLLQRLTGEDDLVVGTPIAGRTRAETEPLIGLFVNTLVLRTGLSGDPDFVAILARVREAALSAYAHQEVPFERLVEELAPERDLSRTPLVQVMLVLQNTPLGRLELPGLALRATDLTTETAKLDLTCTLVETERGLAGAIEYSRDLFEAPTIERLAGHFGRLLAAAAADPRRRLSELPLLSDAERAQLLVEWNDESRPFPETTLHAAFEHQAALHPGLPAVVSGGMVLTYGELDASANRLARRLVALGVGPEVPVALAFERSAAVIVAILGVLKAGGAYLPLDPGQPADRLAALLESAGQPLLVTEKDLEAANDPVTAPIRSSVPENLAYVLHTSGSTGKPKGVCCTHRGVLNLLADFTRRQPLVPGSRGSLWTNLSFDVSVYEIFAPLLAGGAVHIVPDAIRQEAERFLDWLVEERIDSAYVPPFMVAGLLERMERTGGEPALRRLLVGVEPIPEAQLARIAELCPGLAIINGYGPTEATICATLYDVDPRRERSGSSPLSPITPIGRPAANSGIYLLDRRQQPVPIGVPGDLYIAGAGLARGYLGRPDATAERFVPHPWSAAGGERLYRTGDLVRRRGDGNLEFLGRIDHQIKLRGFRIEPGEIETALLAHPGVREAVVLAVGSAALDGREHRRLVAYVAGAEGAAPSSQELREHLRERLPGYMVPAAYVSLPALPLTPSGKLDRKALPAPLPEDARDEPTPPRTPTEELVAGIFAEVLGVERVGVTEDFFGLGGHSLLATRVTSRVRTVFGVELPVRVVFESPTVEGLAGWLDRSVRTGEIPAIARISREESPVLSFAQQRLWFLDQLEPGSPVYNIPVAVELTGRLDRGALEAVLREVVRRHKVLRTTFRTAVDGPVQVVAERVEITLPLVDLQDADEERRLIAEEARRPFDLGGRGGGSLLRALLLRTAAERHVLLLTMHHIVSDGWSMGVLVREIGALYAGAPLPELAIQYADFAAWQRNHLSGEHLESELAWWRGELAGMPTVLDLPLDHPRPPSRSPRGAVHELAIGPEILAGLTALSRQQGATLFMTLLAGFAVLLQRYAGQDDLAVGTPIAGRTREETELLIGLFVNTLVLRADLSGDPPLADLLERVRETTLSAYGHQEVPFERLVEELVPERDLSRPPLVQVLFVLQNTPSGPLERNSDQLLPGLTLRAEDASTGTAKFDLTLTLIETEEGLAGTIEFSRDLFDASTIERMAGHFTRLLAAAATGPRRRLSELELLSEAEREQLLVAWRGAAADYPREATIDALFARQAALRPDTVAVAGAGESLTYGEVRSRAGRWARRLRAAGVGPEVRVGLCLDRSPARVVATLAVLEAGGVYVPLDPSYPRERLSFLLRDSAAPVLVTEERWLEILPPLDAVVLCLDRDEGWDEDAGPAGAPPVPASALAYIMYTSGSTGEPKGVAVPHRAVVRLVRETGFARFGPDEVFLQLAPYAFDASTLEIWGALLHGGRLVVPPPGALSPAELGQVLERHGVTTLWLTASLFHQMVEENLPGLAGVRQLLAGGDVLSVPHVRRVLNELPGTRLVNGYGPTENTTFTCCHAMPGPEPLVSSVPLGRPIANTWVYVLDRSLQPVPVGVAGELCAGGDGLARGYLGRPDLTAERFVPDPFGEEGERLYRTGDLVRRRPSGDLELLGRIDSQVKIRGFRIEPGEIEAALLAHPWVREAVVLPQKETAGGRRLVAYLAGDGETPGPAELRSFLRERLPDFMVPSAWVFLSSLPLNPNGKVDRKALAELRPARGGSGAAAAPRTTTEELVAAIYAEALDLERVGVTEDFFGLGGHSLLATRVVSRLHSIFGVEVPVRMVFEAPTVEGLAGRLEGLWGGEGPAPRAGLPRTPRDGRLVLSFAQERLWFLDQLEPGSAVYNVPAAIELAGGLAPAVLAAALGEVVRRHEALRTTFQLVEGEPVQVIAEPAAVALPLIDLQGLPERERENEARRLMTAEARRPFDLGRGPLLRTALLVPAAERHVLLLTLHHIVSDGWSMGVLVRELGALYGAFAAGRPSPLPELTVQYADFSAWQRRRMSGEHLETELAWWREKLAGMPPALDLPADHPRPAARSLRGAGHTFAIPEEDLASLMRLSRQQGATLFMSLLAGFAVLLQRYAGQDDLAVGTPIAGRTREETEPLIGLFVNTLVLRADLSGDPPLADLLGRVREMTLSAYAHQEVPFERLVEELVSERDLSRTPLIQVLFILQNAPSGPLELPGLTLRASEVATEVARVDLTFALVETGGGLAGTIEYSRDLFEAPAIGRLAAHFIRLLAGAAAGPRQRLSELPLLSTAEQEQLLVAWNDVGTLPPSEVALHELFEAQVARTPEAVALVAGLTGERWTYRELDLRADSLAHRLVALGVAPEVRVGVCLTRTPLLVASLLGILKAGGAYVPLDPEYPGERLAFMLEDTAAAVLLTEPGLVDRLPGHRAELLVVEPGFPAQEGPRVASGVQPGNLAYLIYTSGSTGRPKGVAIEHRSAVAFAHWARTVFPPEDLAGVLAATSVSFDLSIFELFVTLAWGGKVVLAANALELPRLKASAEVVLINTVPSALAELVRQGAVPESVRTINLAGEPLKRSLVQAIYEGSSVSRVLDLYGPSESTTYSTWAPADRAEQREPAIGRPIAGTRVVLLGRRGEPVPAGVPGELLIGGAGLARGYLHRPDLTAERFVPDVSGGRLYRTGDLARWLPDGRLEYLGRIDQQVKVRGFRIELGEIEEALARHPGVREAVVLAREDLAGGPGLAAYVVAAEGEAPEPSALRDVLRQRLPEFMLPAAWAFLPGLPLTPSGKIDRKALAKLRPERPAVAAGEAPRTPSEELMAGIFTEVLGVERVSATDDFFVLGGHSLLATRLASRVRSVFGVELPVRAVFERPTVAGLVAEIAAKSVEGRLPEVPPMARVERAEALPLSFGQERLCFLQQLDPGSAAYDMPVQVELSGVLHRGALSAALTEVVRRHESLRTTFGMVAGAPAQRIAPPPAAFPLPLADLSELPAAAAGLEAERLEREHAETVFDLERGPLLRALLVRLGGERHRLLLNLHHIVSDGWSIGVLVRELGALYAAFLEGKPSPLPELPIQYPDFAVWQREQLATWQAAELAYWEEHLGGEVAAVELPADRPRPAIQTFRGGGRQLALSPDLTARLKSLGRAQGVTLFMMLLAAAKAVLSRHSGETDLTIGAPIAGRRWAETEGLIGFFLNTLALRTDLSGGPGFRELLARVRATTLEAYSHQDVPFEAVLARLRLDRDLSRSPLFQVLFNMLNLPAQDLSLPGLDLRVLTPAEVPSKFDMTFYLAESESQVLINLVYNADLFDEARMAGLLAQLELLLAQAVERPEEPVDGLTLVTGEMLWRLPDPTAPLDAGWIGGVHELFAAQAGRASERPAVIDGGLVWSYGDLLAGCRGLAGWLAVHGVRPGDPVAILAHRSAPLVQAIVGVLTAGAAFTVIDPAYPAWRQAEMLRLARPRAWVALEAAGPVSEEVRDWLREAGCPCLELPAGAAALESLAPFAEGAPQVAVGPQDVACIGFTSGSTGGPKAILGLHGALSHFLPIQCREFGIGPDERFSLLSGLAHDPLQRDIFTPLFLGAAIIVPDPADSGIAGRWAEWMRHERVTVANLTPSLAQLLTERPPGGEVVTVPSLRLVFLVGEALTRRDVARLRAMAPGVACINLYGATETQRALAFHLVAPEDAEAAPERARQMLPLGRGMQDMQLLVVNRAGKLAGLGEIGEILVRSPHLARGYLGNEELTAERFQINPFTGEAGDRIYRTGDLGRYLPDGEVAFAGRSDFQIKLRGFRIELGEIEAALASHPGVREAVVLLRTDLPGGDALVASVVPAAGPLETAELHDYLWQRLPAYMVPAAFLLLDAMPLTPNGKVDRRALARQAVQTAAAGAAGRALLGPVEEIVAGLWSEVLGLERIGPDDNFFQLGGHSLTGAQVVSRLRAAFSVELPLRVLFEAPTVATLAAEVERRRRPEGAPELPSIASFREDRSAPPPLSFAQERYWASREQEARTVASTIPVMVLFKGPLDLECLRRALQEVAGRHEVLRTAFREDAAGRPIQVIDPVLPVRFPMVDLEPLSPDARTAEIQHWSIADGRRQFDFTRVPLFRLTVFRCAEEEHVFLFTVHHSAFDGWSSSVLLRELGLIYNAFREGRPSPLPPLAAQYQDFARWQRHTLAGEGLERQVAFWREHLRGARPVDLCAGPRPTRWTYEAGMEAFTVPEELEKRLDAFAAQHGVTLFMLLLAAFKALLREETGREDIVVTCLFANRNHFEIENLIGNFFAGLPLRTRFSSAGTFRDLLERVRDETLAAHEHPDILYEPVMEGQGFLEKGDRGGLATFRIMFQLAKLPPAKQTLSDLDVIRLPFDTGKIRQDLTLFLSQSGRLLGRFKYNRDVLDPERVALLRDRYLRILASAVDDPDRPLPEL